MISILLLDKTFLINNKINNFKCVIHFHRLIKSQNIIIKIINQMKNKLKKKEMLLLNLEIKSLLILIIILLIIVREKSMIS